MPLTTSIYTYSQIGFENIKARMENANSFYMYSQIGLKNIMARS